MTSLFPEATHTAPSQPIDYDDIPEGLKENFRHLLDWFTPTIYVSWIILAVNVLVFGAMLLSGINLEKMGATELGRWGANEGYLTITQGQWWRLVSSAFIHLGFLHIAFNMMVLYQIGPFMERFLGNVGFLFVYLASAVSGAVCSVAWDPYIYSAGASGAIFGLYGALIGFLLLRRDSIPGEAIKSLMTGALTFIGYNAVFGFIHEGTDVAGHVGGLLGGFLCGLIVSTPITAGFRRRRYLRSAIASGICVALSLAVLLSLPKPVDLVLTVDKFAGVEKGILAKYVALLSSKTLNDDQLAANIQTQVIAPWHKERQSLPSSARMHERQRELVDNLTGYMDGREKAWNELVSALKKHDQAATTKALADEKEVTERATNSMSKLKSEP